MNKGMRDVFQPSAAFNQEASEKRKWKWHEPVRYEFPRGCRLVREALPLMPPAAIVLFYGLLEYLGWDNQVTDSLSRVAHRIGMVRKTATRALVRLEQARLVSVDRSHPTLLRITVSPYLVWQGRPHRLYEARRMFDEQCHRALAAHAPANEPHEAGEGT